MATTQSTRIAIHLASSSITPLSEDCCINDHASAKREDIHCQLYKEAKLALSKQDFDVALILFKQCPQLYRNTSLYISQCAIYNRLLQNGIVQRNNIHEIRKFLERCLLVPHDSPTVAIYAELLMENGYTLECMCRMTVRDCSTVVSILSLPSGHKALFEAHCRLNSSTCSNGVFVVKTAFGTFDECIKRISVFKRIIKKK
jgi:hypothetical protein